MSVLNSFLAVTLFQMWTVSSSLRVNDQGGVDGFLGPERHVLSGAYSSSAMQVL